LTDRFRVVPASYVFLLRAGPRGDEVLLQLRQNTGYMDAHWAAAAAGHLERGETAYDAAQREAREEIGVDGLELEFVTSMQRTRHADPIDERVDFFFTARRWRGDPRIVEPAKCAALEWFALTALPDPVVPHESEILTRLGVGVPPYTTYGFNRPDPSLATAAAPTAHRKETRMVIELGEQPQPHVEPAEPNPGGVDALPDVDLTPVVPDLSLSDNPAVDDAAPEKLTAELGEPEDTEDGASTDGASEPEKEAQA
jgi:8-oxo-dGTP pyrophosphatase MutT (NUDIX family)